MLPYDNLDRITEKKYNGDVNNRAVYRYGNDGSLAQTIDFSTGTRTKFTYDLADRLVSQKEYTGTGANGGTLRSSTDFTYADKTNYLTGVKHFSPLGTQNIGYTYGDINNGEMPDQIYKVSWNGQEKISNAYDSLGRLGGKFIFTDGATLTYAYGYENVDEIHTTTLVSSVRTPFGVCRYTYDAVGNITSVAFGTKYTNTYEYDSLNQLVRENSQQIGKTYTYAYVNGNITERKEYAYTTGELGEVLDTKTWSYTDSAWSDLLTEFNGKTISYDEIGNPTTIGNQSLSWNGRQLQEITDSENTYTYLYNADGQRVSKTVNGVTTEYFYNGSILAGQKTGNDTLVFMYDNNGDTFGFTYNGETYYYVKNVQNDVFGITDHNRVLLVNYAYDAWGKVVSVTDANGNEITDMSHIGHINPIRYRSYYFDSETNFYYLNSRYYSPEMCRFLNADGLFDNRGLNTQNLFQYCANNPVNNIDSDGHLFGALVLIGLLTIGLGLLSGCGRDSAPTPSTTTSPSTTSPSTSKATSELTDEQKKFVAVVAGEAIGANSKTRKAVAHTIVNRVKEPKDIWNKVTCINDVLVKSQYNSVDGPEYNKAMRYLNNRDGNNSTYESLIADVIPIYYGEENDFTGGAHYIFNANTKSGQDLETSLKKQPNRYIKCGPFDGISDTEYRMYRCVGG